MQAQQGPSPCLFQPASSRENGGPLRHRPLRQSVFEPLESVRLRRQCKRKAVETSIQVCAKRLHVAVERGLELCGDHAELVRLREEIGAEREVRSTQHSSSGNSNGFEKEMSIRPAGTLMYDVHVLSASATRVSAFR